MNKTTHFTAEEALEQIWKLGSDSELDDLGNSDDDDNDDDNDDDGYDDDEIIPNLRIGGVDETDDYINLKREEAREIETPETEKLEITETESSEGNVGQEEEENAQTLIAVFEKHQPHWPQKQTPGFPTAFLGKKFTLLQNEVKDWFLMKYFKLFWKDDLNELTSEQTNLYSVQQNGKYVATTSGEIEQVIGLQMYMSIVQIPTYNMYWEILTRLDPTADAIPRNRYQLSGKNLHVSDNLKREDSNNFVKLNQF